MPRLGRTHVIASALAMLALAIAACDSGDDGTNVRCTPDEYLCLSVGSADSEKELDVQRYGFPIMPVLPGERVDVELRGANPGEEAQVFSTQSLYNYIPVHADDDGVISLTIEGTNPGEHSFLVVGDAGEDLETPATWRFMIVAPERPQFDETVIAEAGVK